MGIEPTTGGITIRNSTTELLLPLFLYECRQLNVYILPEYEMDFTKLIHPHLRPFDLFEVGRSLVPHKLLMQIKRAMPFPGSPFLRFFGVLNCVFISSNHRKGKLPLKRKMRPSTG